MIILQTIIGGIIAILIYLYINSRKSNIRIGQKVYYYFGDKNKLYSGRVIAILTCKREEDSSINQTRRIVPLSEKKIRTMEYKMFEIQPIIGGDKICISDKQTMKEIPKDYRPS